MLYEKINTIISVFLQPFNFCLLLIVYSALPLGYFLYRFVKMPKFSPNIADEIVS